MEYSVQRYYRDNRFLLSGGRILLEYIESDRVEK